MKRPRPPVRLAALALAAALLAAACGDSGGGTTFPADPDTVLAASVDAMSAVQSLHFELERGGAPVTVAGLEFDSAIGEYSAPDSAQALLRVKTAGLSVEVGTIAIGDRVWLTNPLTQQWDEFPAGTGFNPAIIFDPEVGWRPLLVDDISDVRIDAGGSGPYVVHGTVAPSRVEVLTAGLVSEQAVDVELSIDRETARVLQVAFATEGEQGESSWVLRLDEFDEPVTITPPDGG